MKYYFDNTNIPLNNTEDDERFDKATECWLKNQPFAPLSLVNNLIWYLWKK